MGLLASLNAVAVTAAEQASGQLTTNDITGSVSLARNRAVELIANCKNIVAGLPVGDPNIATLNTLIGNLS